MKRNRILTGTYVKETPLFLPQSCDFLLVKNFQNFCEEERNLVCMCITHRDIRSTGDIRLGMRKTFGDVARAPFETAGNLNF